MILYSFSFAEDQSKWFHQSNKDRDAMYDQVYSQLNLTAAQQQQITESRTYHRQQMKQLSQIMQDKRAQLRNELEKSDTDKNKVYQIAAELKAVDGQMIDERIASIFKVKEILNFQQYQQLNQATRNFIEQKKGKQESFGEH
jgi:Spy/CpxP family protein refolding chaperone